MANGLKSEVAVSNLGVGAMVWINILEPLWQAFKDPLPEKKAKEIVENIHMKLTNPSNQVFDDMIRIGAFLGGQSDKEISSEVVKVRFKYQWSSLFRFFWKKTLIKPNQNFQNAFWDSNPMTKQRLVTLGKDVMARIGEKLMKEFKDSLENMNLDQMHTYRNC